MRYVVVGMCEVVWWEEMSGGGYACGEVGMCVVESMCEVEIWYCVGMVHSIPTSAMPNGAFNPKLFARPARWCSRPD